jgi:dephospho-CoA kinase
MAAQMPVSEKALKSQYVIKNDGTVDELEKATEEFIRWLKAAEKPR